MGLIIDHFDVTFREIAGKLIYARSFSRSVGQNRPAGRSSKIDRDRPTSTDREH